MRFLRCPEVVAITAKSRSSIYAAIKRGEFPAPLKLSGPNGRAVAWSSESIAEWQKSCVIASRSK